MMMEINMHDMINRKYNHYRVCALIDIANFIAYRVEKSLSSPSYNIKFMIEGDAGASIEGAYPSNIEGGGYSYKMKNPKDAEIQVLQDYLVTLGFTVDFSQLHEDLEKKKTNTVSPAFPVTSANFKVYLSGEAVGGLYKTTIDIYTDFDPNAEEVSLVELVDSAKIANDHEFIKIIESPVEAAMANETPVSVLKAFAKFSQTVEEGTDADIDYDAPDEPD